MLHLLQLELKKFSNYRPFRLMALFYVVLLPMAILATKMLPAEAQKGMGMAGFYTFPRIWEYLGYFGNWMAFFFLGFMGVLVITSEFVIGVAHEGSFDINYLFDPIGRLGRYLLMCFGYMIFGAFLGTLFRRTGLAVFLFLVYGIFLELIIRWGIHGYLLEAKRGILFYPLNAFEDLAPVPFNEIADQWIRQYGFDVFLSPTEAMVTSSIYIGLFLFGIYALLTRRDL